MRSDLLDLEGTLGLRNRLNGKAFTEDWLGLTTMARRARPSRGESNGFEEDWPDSGRCDPVHQRRDDCFSTDDKRTIRGWQCSRFDGNHTGGDVCHGSQRIDGRIDGIGPVCRCELCQEA